MLKLIIKPNIQIIKIKKHQISINFINYNFCKKIFLESQQDGNYIYQSVGMIVKYAPQKQLLYQKSMYWLRQEDIVKLGKNKSGIKNIKRQEPIINQIIKQHGVKLIGQLCISYFLQNIYRQKEIYIRNTQTVKNSVLRVINRHKIKKSKSNQQSQNKKKVYYLISFLKRKLNLGRSDVRSLYQFPKEILICSIRQKHQIVYYLRFSKQVRTLILVKKRLIVRIIQPRNNKNKKNKILGYQNSSTSVTIEQSQSNSNKSYLFIPRLININLKQQKNLQIIKIKNRKQQHSLISKKSVHKQEIKQEIKQLQKKK